ncbi:MAG: PAS domain S-box protein [Deltaproteobacteria bacterium]|nr:PAS domain S-box protein [Deltaproteobacteria bacterium]
MNLNPPTHSAPPPAPLLLAEAMAALAAEPAEAWLLLYADGTPALVSAAVPRALGDAPESLCLRQLTTMCAAMAGRWPRGLRIDDQRGVRFVPLSQGAALALIVPAATVEPPPDPPGTQDLGDVHKLLDDATHDLVLIQVVLNQRVSILGKQPINLPWAHVPTLLDAVCQRVHPEEANGVRRRLTDLFERPRDFNLQMRSLCPVRGWRWRLVRGRMIDGGLGGAKTMICADVDITHEQDTSHGYALASLLIDAAPEPLWVANEAGELLITNAATRRTLAWEPPPEARATVRDLFPRLDPDGWDGLLSVLRSTTGGQVQLDDTLSPGGERDAVRLHARRVSLDGAEYVLGAATDLTLISQAIELRERREAERLIAEATASLVRSVDHSLEGVILGVLEAIGRYTGARVAHTARLNDAGDELVEDLVWRDQVRITAPLRAPFCANVFPFPPEVTYLELIPHAWPPGLDVDESVGGVSAAMFDGDQVIGTVCLYWDEEGFQRRPAGTIQLLNQIAELVSRALARRAVDRAVRDRARQLRTLLGNLPGLVYRAQAGADARILLASDGARHLLGRDPSDLLGAPLSTIIDPRDAGWVAEAHARHQAGDRGAFEYRVRYAEDDRLIWVQDSYTVSQDPMTDALVIDGFLTDITNKRLAAEVRDMFFTQSQAPMLVVDDSTQIYRWNKAFEDLVGFSTDELQGLAIAELVGPEDYTPLVQQVLTQLGQGPRFSDVDCRVRCKDGRHVQLSVSGFVEMGRPVRSFVTVRDLTAAREAEDAARRQQAQLEQAQRLESLGVMAGGLAHDFNNLIGVVMGAIELVRLQVPGQPNILRQLKRVNSAMERSAQIVAQLLAFGRRQVSQRGPLGLNELIEENLALLHGTVPADVILTLRLGAGRWAHADASQVEQVLMNLVVNALDAMPNGGHLEVETDDTVLDGPGAAALGVSPGPYIVMAVQDSGTGITPDVMARLFEPFFTTKDVGRGTGLGLPSCYGILSQHNGALRVTSTPGQGSRFEALWPAAEDQGQPRRESQIALSLAGRGARVMVVEDNADLCELISEVLTQSGYEVHALGRGDEALAALQTEAVELLLTDVVMPGTNGVELVRQIAKTRPALRTLTMSGYAWAELVSARHLSPDARFLRKPFTNEELLRAVSDALTQSP